MKKVFHFDSQTDEYRPDACVVSCFDARFELVTRKFLKKRGIWWADPLKIAGGTKAFASPAEESERSFAAQIALANQHIRGIGFDLLQVATVFKEYIAALGVTDMDYPRIDRELRSSVQVFVSFPTIPL